MESVIHVVYPLGRDAHPLDIRAAVHDGTVLDVATEIMRGIESHGHSVEKEHGDYSGPDGAARAIAWQTTVTLKDRDYTVVWQHIVRNQDDAYTRVPADYQETANGVR